MMVAAALAITLHAIAVNDDMPAGQFALQSLVAGKPSGLPEVANGNLSVAFYAPVDGACTALFSEDNNPAQIRDNMTGVVRKLATKGDVVDLTAPFAPDDYDGKAHTFEIIVACDEANGDQILSDRYGFTYVAPYNVH